MQRKLEENSPIRLVISEENSRKCQEFVLFPFFNKIVEILKKFIVS